MDSIGDGLAYFEQHWPELRSRLEAEGPGAAVASILDCPSDAERTALFRHARRGMILGEWEGKSLDAYLEVVDAGCAWLSEKAQTGDPAERNGYLAVLAEVTFNSAADLADCWPGDEEPRRDGHFQRGVELAEQSVGLRTELNKPDTSQHLGWWAFGYHQLRLGHTDAAADCMERSLGYARRAARDAGQHDAITSQAPFPVLIGAGYLGLARIADGEPSGPDLYGEALAAFRAQLTDPDRKEDAQFGIDQLERVRALIPPDRAR